MRSEAFFSLSPWYYSNLVSNVAFSFARKALHRFLAASFASNCAPTRTRPNATGVGYIAMLIFRLARRNPYGHSKAQTSQMMGAKSDSQINSTEPRENWILTASNFAGTTKEIHFTSVTPFPFDFWAWIANCFAT